MNSELHQLQKENEELQKKITELQNQLTEYKNSISNDFTDSQSINKQDSDINKQSNSNNDWEKVFQAISSPAVILNPEYIIVHANNAVYKKSGLQVHEVIGKHCYEIFHAKGSTCPPENCPCQKLISLQKNSITEMEIEAFDGIYLVSCTPIYDSNGVLQQIIHIATDVTARKQYYEALVESEKKFRELTNFLPQTVYETDLAGNLTFVNQNGIQMFGYSQEDFENGVNIFQMLIPEDIEKAKKNIELLFTASSNTGNEYTAIHKMGKKFPIVIYSSIFYQNNKPKGLRGILIDVSEQKEFQKILQENQRKLESLISNLPGMVYRCLYDETWTMLYISDSCKTITGYTSDDFTLNKNISFNQILTKEDNQRLVTIWSEAIKNNEIFQEEYQIIDALGNRKWVWERGHAVYDEIGEVLFLEGYIEDITERKHAEGALKHSILALSQPLDNVENIEFSDLFNLANIQKIQDEFASATGVASIITKPDGTPITKPSNFCRLCSSIIRNTEIGNKNCCHSDAVLGKKNTMGPTIQPCLSGGLIDAGASIVVGGKHIANWLIGQVKTEDVHDSEILAYAAKIGANEEEFKLALQEVPTMSKKQFEKISESLFTFANELSLKAYQNIQQARFITEIQQKESTLKEKSDEIEAQNEEYLQLNEELLEANERILDEKEKAQLNEEKYKSIISNLPVISFVIDKEGIFVLSEGKGLELLGLKPGQVVGVSSYDIYAEFPEIIDSIQRALQGETVRIENIVGPITFDVIYSPMYDDDGSIYQLIGLAHDISEQKNAVQIIKDKSDEIEAQNEEYLQLNEELLDTNQELYLAKQKAEESDHLKSTFLANLSHEIRTPMNAIMGFSDLLLEEDLEKESKEEYVSIIQKSGTHLMSIINDLIDVSKIETGQVVPYVTKIAIQTFLKDLQQSIQITIPKEKNITFSITTTNISENSIVFSDEIKLRQILINLIVNAIKFTDSGYVSVECEQLYDNSLICKVKDTGLGISSENFELIFERFRQVEGDSSIQKGGSGLGLAISKAYVEMLGGSISVNSEIGKGSEFIFTIQSVTTNINTPSHKKSKSNTMEIQGNYETILVAEDDDVNYFYLTKLFAKTNYLIIRACNGQEAIKQFEMNPQIKLILMDIKMPVMNGYEAASHIRKLKPSIPIIAQTAYALSEDECKAKQTGFADYISKPLKREKLLELVNTHIQNQN